MKPLFKNIYEFFPIQLLLLHLRKFQVLLLFWVLLTSTINSGFMKNFGADALFFAPEYLGSVNMLSTFITGVALGIFIMSWNITTFILHSKRFNFLATTSNPFLKYCINNSIIPLLFVIFYFVRLVQFDDYRELMDTNQILTSLLGILTGIIFLLAVSFVYFFGTGKSINRTVGHIIDNPSKYKQTVKNGARQQSEFGLKANFYLSTFYHIRKARNVSHYRKEFLESVFKRYHLVAIICMLLAFFFLVMVGFFLEYRIFEMPAAASILIFFAVMTAFIGALSYFLQSWSLPVAVLILIILNILYTNDLIDPRNKAYGLNYLNKTERPLYNKTWLLSLCDPGQISADRENMLQVLEQWKKKQTTEKPLMFFINVSGGGLRSAAFVMNSLQQLDSLTNGKLMQHTFMFSGASGGMLAATYYRELYRKKLQGEPINLYNPIYSNYITNDLLNPVFTSMMARDIFAPMQRFSVGQNSYIKDRGYAFEKKLSDNTQGVLNVQLKDIADDEKNARVPMIIFNAVINNDGRKLLMGTQPLSFMMKPRFYHSDTTLSPDAVDFAALFKKQNPMDLRVLTALRMNATFPYVLPNVWLPSKPIIDVMDAGLRDNIGTETSLRFIDNFKEWITENTSGVIILQLKDRVSDDWLNSGEPQSLADIIVTPATMLQHNWFSLQSYAQADQISYFNNNNDSLLQKITVLYKPAKFETTAALNFHLSAREKRDIIQSFYGDVNTKAIEQIKKLLQ